MANLIHPPVLFRLLIIYTRFAIIYSRLYSFENVFIYLYQNISAVEKKCLDCGDTLRGRTDKKFCSDQCRNNFNNKINRDSNNFVRNVHGLLRKNRRILADLYSEGKVKVHKDALFALGYNFSFFTHIIETSQGNKFHYCFEYGYRETGDDFLELRENSQYIDYQ
jgi:predicted nucleic acid-binding Zn ribbon protein